MCVHNSPRFLMCYYLRTVNQMKFIWCTSLKPKKMQPNWQMKHIIWKDVFFVFARLHEFEWTSLNARASVKWLFKLIYAHSTEFWLGYFFLFNLITNHINYDAHISVRERLALSWSGIVLASILLFLFKF